MEHEQNPPGVSDSSVIHYQLSPEVHQNETENETTTNMATSLLTEFMNYGIVNSEQAVSLNSENLFPIQSDDGSVTYVLLSADDLSTEQINHYNANLQLVVEEQNHELKTEHVATEEVQNIEDNSLEENEQNQHSVERLNTPNTEGKINEHRVHDAQVLTSTTTHDTTSYVQKGFQNLSNSTRTAIHQNITVLENRKQYEIDNVKDAYQLQVVGSDSNLFRTERFDKQSKETERISLDNQNDVTKRKNKPRPDYSKPIKLTEKMMVVVDGKKCYLRPDPITGELCAFPAKIHSVPGKRRLGRPRKGEEKKAPISTPQPRPVTPVETILDYDNIASDGTRRSIRSKKRTTFLEDYDLGKPDSDGPESGEDQGALEDEPSGPVKRGRGRPPKVGVDKTGKAPGVKRGRGRPRKQYTTNNEDMYRGPIPALLIRNADGQQTILLAPGQTLQDLQEKQDSIVPNITIDDVYGRTPVLIQRTANHEAGFNDVIQRTSNQLPGLSDVIQGSANQEGGLEDVLSLEVEGETSSGSMVINLGSEWSAPGTSMTDEGGMDDQEENEGGITEEENRGGSEIELLTATAAAASESYSAAPLAASEEEIISTSSRLPDPPIVTAAMVTVPEELISNLTNKNSHTVLGLKTSDLSLEQYVCGVCNYQAYYSHHYQDHLINSHPDLLITCKCCDYVSLDTPTLQLHYKFKHPRNYCSYCGMTSEKSYIIKRHMQRHTDKGGCDCHICGKVFKDVYILKQHIKMVHMPADLLYECDTCGKNFTRKSHLKRHLVTHQEEKPHKCPLCDYRAIEQADITKHKLIHDAPKLHCVLCGKYFRHAKNKNLHMKRHKKQRDYKCGICDFYGYTFSDIRKHIERVHVHASYAQTFKCQHCYQTYATPELFQEHQNNGSCEMMVIQKVLTSASSTHHPNNTVLNASTVTSQQQYVTITSPENVTSQPEYVTSQPEYVTITSADEVTSPQEYVTITPGDNVTSQQEYVTITPADNVTSQQEYVTITPSENVTSQQEYVTITSADNVTSQQEYVTITPADNVTSQPEYVTMMSADEVTSQVAMTSQTGVLEGHVMLDTDEEGRMMINGERVISVQHLHIPDGSRVGVSVSEGNLAGADHVTRHTSQENTKMTSSELLTDDVHTLVTETRTNTQQEEKQPSSGSGQLVQVISVIDDSSVDVQIITDDNPDDDVISNSAKDTDNSDDVIADRDDSAAGRIDDVTGKTRTKAAAEVILDVKDSEMTSPDETEEMDQSEIFYSNVVV